MTYLVDTNVISELRKGGRANSGVRAWFDEAIESELYLSVLVVGEIRAGVERVRRRDAEAAQALDRWLSRLVESYDDRVLPITPGIAQRWGRLNAGDPLPVIDSLLAATALEHDLTVVTRNVGDIRRTDVPVLDPFD